MNNKTKSRRKFIGAAGITSAFGLLGLNTLFAGRKAANYHSTNTNKEIKVEINPLAVKRSK